MNRGILAVGVLVAVIVGMVMMRQGDATQPGNQTATPAAPTPPVTAVYPETHVFNCGEPDFLSDKFITKEGKELIVLKTGTVSMGEEVKYLDSPKWINQCGLDDIKEKPGYLAGYAIYNFETQRDDTFYVFVRAKWTDTCGNSVWIKIDGNPGKHGPDDGIYHNLEDQIGMVSEKNYTVAWHPLLQAGKMFAFVLPKGKHTLELHTREDGPRFEQAVVSTEANVPVGGLMRKR